MMDKKNAATLLLVGITAGALYLCYLLVRPYAAPILFALVVAIVFYPLHRYSQRAFRNRSGSAILTTLVTLLLTVIPLTFLLIAISSELRGLYQSLAVRSAGEGGVTAYLLHSSERITSWISAHLPIPAVNLRSVLLSRVESASTSLVRLGANLVGNVFSLAANAVIALVVLFFLFRDGENAMAKVMAALPWEQARLTELRTRISSAVTTNVYGGVVVGALQGTLTGLSFWALGIDSPVLWGVVTAVLSLVPMFGSALVWLPASIVLMFTGHVVKGVILLVLGIAVIGTVDNIVRPIIIHKSLRLHPILVLFSILGGVQLFGVLGVLVGPVILSVTAALLAMVQQELSSRDEGPGSKEPPAIHIAAQHK
ncbi:MAG TPA: AI-2E family transporter [Candidatus Angelobacter sp.]|nr:AI-2E family transporter [Candidatus Angelobacter sp.]